MTPATIAPAAQADHGAHHHEGHDMNPNEIDTRTAERIGFHTTFEEGKTHWSELAVYFLTEERWRRRPFLAELVGKTLMHGERDRVQRISAGSFARAVKLFHDSTAARAVIAEAQQWLAEQGRDPETGFPKSFGLPKTDADALAFLYGDVDPKTWPRLIEQDFGIGESTTRMALSKGHAVKLPLLSILRWFDREAFQRDRASHSAKEFTDQTLRQIASNLGVTYDQLTEEWPEQTGTAAKGEGE